MNPTVNTDSDYAGKRWNATFDDLAVDGNFTVTGTSTLTGNVLITGTLGVTGLTSMVNATCSGTLGVTGASTLNTTTLTTGNLTTTAGDVDLTVGDVHVAKGVIEFSDPTATVAQSIGWFDAAGNEYGRIEGLENTRDLKLYGDDGATGVERYISLAGEANGPVFDMDTAAGVALRLFDHDADPNVAFAGNIGNMVMDVAAKKLWMCSVAGAAGAATWVGVVLT